MSATIPSAERVIALEAALRDLVEQLSAAHDTDFGSVQIEREAAADFWAALDAAKMLLDLINKGIEDEAENEAIKAVERAEVEA